MHERRRGGIILTGSLAGYMGSPSLAAYCAAQAFSRVFTEALWAERQPLGVDVLHLNIGFTPTRAPGARQVQRGFRSGAFLRSGTETHSRGRRRACHQLRPGQPRPVAIAPVGRHRDQLRGAAVQQQGTLQRQRGCRRPPGKTLPRLCSDDYIAMSIGATPIAGGKTAAAALAVQLANVTTVHHCHTPVIDFQDRDHATGIWAMEGNLFWKRDGEQQWLRGFGFYHETYVRGTDGQGRFTYRKLERTHAETSPGAALLAADFSGENLLVGIKS